MKNLFISAITLPIASSCTNTTQTPSDELHESAYIQKMQVNIEEHDFPSVNGDNSIQIRNHIPGHRLIMLVYFSPWCPNFRNEIDSLKRLYSKYQSRGVRFIGVSEYAPIAETKSLIEESELPFEFVIESESREERTKTTHFKYRSIAGDNRKWGSPWHVIINTAGETWVINGEIIDSDIDDFMSKMLDH